MINPLDFNQAHSGSVNLDYRVSGTNSILDGLGSNLLFTFNSGHAFTYVYRPIGGQVSAFDAGVDYMLDTRSRQALEPIGSSTTPWVYNLDLKMDKRFDVGGYGVTVFARVNNLLDRRNSLNVYQATGSSSDDGFMEMKFIQNLSSICTVKIQMVMVLLIMKKCIEQLTLIMMNHIEHR